MKLLVNENHRKADVSKIQDKSKKRTIKLATTAMAMTLTLLSGCGINFGEKSEEKIQSEGISTTDIDDRTSETLNEDTQIEESTITEIESTVDVEQDANSDEKNERDNLIIHDVNPNQKIELKLPSASHIEMENGEIFRFRNDEKDMTVRELQNVKSVSLSLTTENQEDYYNNEENFYWLNYCSNMEELDISNYSGNPTLVYKGINGKNLKNLKRLQISESLNEMEGAENTKYEFLSELENIEELIFFDLRNSTTLNPETLYNLKSLKKLEIWPGEDLKIDYAKLNFLEELTIHEKPYNITMYITNEDIEYLENNGVNVKIEYDNEDIMDQVKEINTKLDEIVNGLEIPENATNQEKLNAILLYVLKNFEYDSEVSNLLENDQINKIDHDEFYYEGYLYAALEKDTQICGNYAAMVQALSKRTGLESLEMFAPGHVFNLVEIDGQYYYVDATWLDGELVECKKYGKYEYVNDDGEIETAYTCTKITFMSAEDAISSGDKENIAKLDWYMADPFNYSGMGTEEAESHEAYNIPWYINIEPIKEKITIDEQSTMQATENITENNEKDENKDISNKKYAIFVKGKKFIIPGAVLVGIMAGLGVAKVAHDKNKRRKKELQRRSDEFDENGKRGIYDCFDDSRSTYSSWQEIEKDIFSSKDRQHKGKDI